MIVSIWKEKVENLLARGVSCNAIESRCLIRAMLSEIEALSSELCSSGEVFRNTVALKDQRISELEVKSEGWSNPPLFDYLAGAMISLKSVSTVF